MFCRKTDFAKIEKIQYRALKIIYNSDLSFEDLLLHSNEVSIHQKHLRQLATEVYKSLNNLSPDFLKPYFTLKDMPYNLRNRSILNLPSAHTIYYGTNAVLFRACLMWNGLPNFIKESNSLIDFKTNIKTIRNIVCSCKICGRS